MTITSFDNLPTLTIPYILRDVSNLPISVSVTNQETKESVLCGEGILSFFYDGYFTIDITALLLTTNKDSTLFVSVLDSNNLPIYRDIIAFSQRQITVDDYEQQENATTGYTFV